MQLAARQLTTFSFRSTRASARRLSPVASAATPAAPSAMASAKRAGATQDRALYTCHCGFAWTAEVSTSIGCPNCGTQQAW